MTSWKKALRFTLCLLPVALIGSYLSVRMSLAQTDPAVLADAVAQLGSEQTVMLASTVSPVMLSLLCAFFGYLLAEKLGLMRPFRLENPPLVRVLLLSAVCGAVLSLDAWTFGRWIPQVGESYAGAGSFDAVTWAGSILYGGVIEEVMLRLGVMSLLAFLCWKLFRRKEAAVSAWALVTANVLAALLFAAAHLPATRILFGALTPLILLRCFLLNGAAGLLFGRFYRKYGIQYAMLAHALFHVVSRTIWLIAF